MVQEDLHKASSRSKHDGIRFTQDDYFKNNSEKLKHIACPNCRDTKCLFEGFNSIGCRSCMTYFSVTELEATK